MDGVTRSAAALALALLDRVAPVSYVCHVRGPWQLGLWLPAGGRARGGDRRVSNTNSIRRSRYTRISIP